MPNHVHLVVRTMDTNLASGMKAIKERHAIRVNRRHGETGHVFEGRYYAGPIRTDAHLLQSIRYVVRNPVRARLCAAATDWDWSSHPAVARSHRSAVVATDDLLALFDAEDPASGLRRYLDFCLPEETTRELVPFRNSLRWQWLDRPPLIDLLSVSPSDSELADAFYRFGYTQRDISLAMRCDQAMVARRLSRWRSHQGV